MAKRVPAFGALEKVAFSRWFDNYGRDSEELERHTQAGGVQKVKTTQSHLIAHAWICAGLTLFAVCVSSADAAPVVEVPGYSIELLGEGFGAATGMALSPSGELFVTDYAGGRVLRVANPSAAGEHTPEVYATGIPYPTDLTAAFGRLLVTSSTGPSSDVIDVAVDGAISAFSTGYSYPVAITSFADHIYVSNSGDGTITRTDSSGASTTFASVFSGSNGPFGAAFDAAGNLYVVVHATGVVLKVDQSGTPAQIGQVTPYGGAYAAVTAEGRVLVADVIQGAVYLIEDAGLTRFAYGFAGKNNAPFNGPNDIVVAPSGTLYIADADKVWRVAPTAPVEVSLQFQPGKKPGRFNLRYHDHLWLGITSRNDFDATQVDVYSVDLVGQTTRANGFLEKDIDADGVQDIAVRMDGALLQLQCGQHTLALRAKTRAGQALRGVASLVVTGCRR